MNSQPVNLRYGQIPPRVHHDCRFTAKIQHAVLAFHIIGFLLRDRSKILACQEHFRRIVDVNMHTHTLVPARNNQ